MFQFATATQIVFGRHQSQSLAKHAAKWGQRVMLVTGANPRRQASLVDAISEALDCVDFTVSGEPSVELVQDGVERAREHGSQVVITVGGGSAIDAGKAIAALATNDGDPLEYLEVIGKGRPLKAEPLPFIAVPTTSGTGAEVTKNAVLSSKEHRVKVSLRDERMLPNLALVDSMLTHDVPPDVTAATGLDALTQVLEPFVSCFANPLTDGLCREGLQRAARALPRVYEDGSDAEARDDMALTSLFGGLALANAKLGAVHGFAGPLGGMFDAPHGALCARLLPLVMGKNLTALRQREPQNPALARYDEVARLLTGNDAARAEDGIEWVRALWTRMKIPGLASYGAQTRDIPQIVEKAARASSMKGNPLQLTGRELAAIVEAAL